MNRTLFIVPIFFTLNLFGQNLTEKVGEIEVLLIRHNFKYNSDYEITKRITNKRNRPFARMYFDSGGLLLKKVSFGKHHNTDLKLIDRIEVYKYSNSKLTESITYESDYQKNIYPYWKSKFIYNKKEQLIDDSMLYYETDSLFHRTTYEYDLNSNKVKSIFNPTYYYQREYDSLNRITSLKQVYENKLRWEWNYKYTNNKRIGIFQTYYNDGKDYSKKEIQTYDDKDFLIGIEEKPLSKSGLDEKTRIYYDKNGLISLIEHYESYGNNEGYVLVSYTKVKVRSKISIESDVAKKVNDYVEIK